MRLRSGPTRVAFLSGKNPVKVFALALSLSLLILWARHEAYWIRQPQPRVHVRWSEEVTSVQQVALEARYELRDPQRDSERTWSYILGDSSATAIRQLLLDPAVEDTQNVDRQRFELLRDVSPGFMDGPFWLLWAAAIATIVGLLAAWIGDERWRRLGSRVWRAGSSATGAVATRLRPAASFLTRGVPELRAEVLGFFRPFYAAFLALAVFTGHLELEQGRVPDDGELGWHWLGWLASRADLVRLLEYALLAPLVLFAIGLWTRIAYWLVAVGTTLWVLVWIESQHSNAHTWVVTLFMILCLVPVPWDAALSVDAAIRRRKGLPAAGKRQGKLYGYAVWMPGLILGTVWASAAYAKMAVSGPKWILGGAVKYHWVVDALQARVDWNQWIASHHWAAVVMSGCGVLFEAVFILSAFLRPGPWQYVFVSTGFWLLLGFYLFHGLLWWTWWLVFLSFAVPWTWLFDVVASNVPTRSRGAARPDVTDTTGPRVELRAIHVILIVVVCVHAMLRLPAGFGRFESYSGTYNSTAEFDRVDPLLPIDRVWVGYGSPAAVEIDADIAVDAISRLAQGQPLSARDASRLQSLRGVASRPRQSPRRLTLTRQRRSFDWTNGRFNPPGPVVVIGTLDLESMTLVNRRSGTISPAQPQRQ